MSSFPFRSTSLPACASVHQSCGLYKATSKSRCLPSEFPLLSRALALSFSKSTNSDLTAQDLSRQSSATSISSLRHDDRITRRPKTFAGSYPSSPRSNPPRSNTMSSPASFIISSGSDSKSDAVSKLPLEEWQASQAHPSYEELSVRRDDCGTTGPYPLPLQF